MKGINHVIACMTCSDLGRASGNAEPEAQGSKRPSRNAKA